MTFIEFLEIKEEDIVKECKNFYKNSGGYHDARFDTISLFLVIKEGINKGYIKGKEKNFLKEVI
ncbi:hypothetical protein [Tepidibacter sp. Z1-5]|uniref:hypothetical protein n=1 Tax=Tepidibacter sp. Z1-5 TaxID=3134138 RepID=UPI0030BF6940